MNPIVDPQKIDQVLSRGVEMVYPTKEAFKTALMLGKKLKMYVGVDPTAPTLHIGHALQMKKLREFQDLGHEVILLIGSFTAMIGDPTDKMATRQQLTAEQVMENAKTYKKQAKKILNFTGENAVKMQLNHKWLSKMSFSDVVELASHFTVQQMSERDMFDKRIKEGRPVYLHEFMYPLMQGYDSVAMEVDAELGGSDQTFNMLAGRTLLREMKQKEKFVVALKLLTNDEGKKMSKSEGGFIAISDTPEDMYGKIMAMNDSMIVPYFELVTDLSASEIEQIKAELAGGANPRDLKMRLGREVVTQFHTQTAAKRAEKHFKTVFQKHEVPLDIIEHQLSAATNILEILVNTGCAASKSEARRLVEQNAVRFQERVVTDINFVIEPEVLPAVLQKGKRQFVKLVR